MTEAEARAWLEARADVSRETLALLDRFAAMLVAANAHQNLISPGSVADMWTRHIVDSAQLVPLGGLRGLWVDIGSGAGLPGIVVAMLRPGPVLLVEPRRRRAEFLGDVVARLGLANATVSQRDIERVDARADVISARAVAPLDRLFAMALHLSHSGTRWVLPKGRAASSELALANRTWHGVFHVEPSITESDSMIVVATDVSRQSP